MWLGRQAGLNGQVPGFTYGLPGLGARGLMNPPVLGSCVPEAWASLSQESGSAGLAQQSSRGEQGRQMVQQKSRHTCRSIPSGWERAPHS